jgi:hypothetical protein
LDDPSHLDRGLEEVTATMIHAGQSTIDAVEANRKKAIDGLKVMSFKSSIVNSNMQKTRMIIKSVTLWLALHGRIISVI